MDYQVMFNIAFSLVGFLGGWVLNNLSKAIERLDTDVRAMPTNYVSKDDLKEQMKTGFDKIDNTLNTIFSKLEKKEDKS